MKYVIQVEIDPAIGKDVEANPAQLQELIATWQGLKPLGMYFALTRRAITIIVEAPNEDAFFEPLHALWRATETYPEVWPVAGIEEFPGILQRVGIGQ
jgi:hypothetical protein